jgi:hypothetical protein
MQHLALFAPLAYVVVQVCWVCQPPEHWCLHGEAADHAWWTDTCAALLVSPIAGTADASNTSELWS